MPHDRKSSLALMVADLRSARVGRCQAALIGCDEPRPRGLFFYVKKGLTSPVRRTEKPKTSYYEKAFETDELSKRRSELTSGID
ncbi:hypothetical protein ASS77_07955 [Staphylococcus saprophyticus]|uniref:hypothetical protein n=3 Tax=Staphylococcus saprophyticus TaxID=29385 RepID=UPI00059F3E05|nr:hypothetical protein [Staphylococcus saprophyticus]OOC98936.1 hypothetical protein BWO95_00900 [Staphylococcus saprophyticus subsp. saprophyticus ATCC 15305 = NCTC 7292]ASE58923.1 hypothetical protein CEQ14_06980 [Staphylococcus saprophyticus]ASF19893.1 hypothetical protein CEQ33_12250 [Staphylococcus saprophyticus]OEK13409.1 hypothetical protein ASS79_11380 [Staphylococcus saprophyticus]OEK14866.1 hypothetical protein ASS77_07955 [Staphylococcus saprophyticus]